MPAAVSHTDINIETNCAKRIELDVFNILRYCKISGTVIKRRARRNLSPGRINKQYLKIASPKTSNKGPKIFLENIIFLS